MNYKESTVAGTSYNRFSRVWINNDLNSKSITLVEDKVTILAGETIEKQVGQITEPFTAENAMTSFKLVNPATGLQIGNSMATYQDVYVMLFSLTMHLAAKRDAALIAPVIP